VVELDVWRPGDVNRHSLRRPWQRGSPWRIASPISSTSTKNQ
jgi:hypothetical protein